MANFNFFGDSWYWVWDLGPKIKGTNPPHIKSKDLIDLNAIEVLDVLQNKHVCTQGHSLYDVYLKHLGHNTRCFCFPAQDWNTTLKTILTTKLNGGIVEIPNWADGPHPWDSTIEEGYTVIFYSNILRGEWQSLPIKPPVHNKKELDNYIEQVNVTSLTKIADWATANKQKVILLGGQTKFNKDTFNKWKRSNKNAPIELASSDVIVTLIRTHVNDNYFIEQDKQDFGYWKLSTDINISTDWDYKVLDEMSEQQKFYEDAVEEPTIKPYLFPDGGHPSLLGQYFILDLILSVVDNKFN